jgi:hypothetical protein
MVGAGHFRKIGGIFKDKNWIGTGRNLLEKRQNADLV